MKTRFMFLFKIELERTKIRILFTLLHAVLLMKLLGCPVIWPRSMDEG